MMEQKLIRFAKIHGFMLGLSFVGLAYGMALLVTVASTFTPRDTFGYEAIQLVHWLFPLLWCAQGFIVLIGVIRENHRCIKVTIWMFCGTIVLETLILLFSRSVPYWGFKVMLTILLVLQNVYACYVLHTLKQVFAGLEKKRQRADVLVTAIVCEGGAGGGQATQNLLPEKNYPAPALPQPELYAMEIIQTLRGLVFGGMKGKGPRPIPIPTDAKEEPKELHSGLFFKSGRT